MQLKKKKQDKLVKIEHGSKRDSLIFLSGEKWKLSREY